MAEISKLIKAGVEYPPMPGPTIKVRALQLGEYEYCRRRPGDVFVLKPREVSITKKGELMMENGKAKMRLLTAEEQFSSRWMQRVQDDTPEIATSAQEALDRAQEELTEGRRPGRPRKERES
jgi:hypothetical protein